MARKTCNEKSDKLDGSKGFEILYLCHPQTGQASHASQKKEEKIKAELYGALQLLLGGAAESYTQLMCSSQHTAKARHCCIPVQLSTQPTLSAEPRHSNTDHWIKSIKQIFNSGLFWAVRATQEKKCKLP